MDIPTPGYGHRLAIFFQTDKNGKRRAYYWSFRQHRSFPIGLLKAELFVSTDLADELPGHPMKALDSLSL